MPRWGGCCLAVMAGQRLGGRGEPSGDDASIVIRHPLAPNLPVCVCVSTTRRSSEASRHLNEASQVGPLVAAWWPRQAPVRAGLKLLSNHSLGQSISQPRLPWTTGDGGRQRRKGGREMMRRRGDGVTRARSDARDCDGVARGDSTAGSVNITTHGGVQGWADEFPGWGPGSSPDGADEAIWIDERCYL